MSSSPVAIVAGGSRGIGRATVRRLLRDGARVAFCGRDEATGRAAEADLAALGDVLFSSCDVGCEQELAAFVAGVAERMGPPTILVNSAGVNATYVATEMSAEQWDAFFAVDLKAAWLSVKHVLPHMLAVGAGAIVNVSSIHAVATRESFFPYAAAKSGLVGLTRSLALDYGGANVRVNCVCPGFTRTRLVEESMQLAADPAAAERAMIAGVALGRIAEPAEVASVIAFLVSEDASYVTGSTVLVDGGLTARRAG